MLAMMGPESRAETPQRLNLGVEEFRAFYSAALPRVYGFHLRRCGSVGVAEDLTQETFAAAVGELRKDRHVDEPMSWIFGIARHKLLDHYRRDGRWRVNEGAAIETRGDARATDEGDGRAMLGAGCDPARPTARSGAPSRGRSVGARDRRRSRAQHRSRRIPSVARSGRVPKGLRGGRRMSRVRSSRATGRPRRAYRAAHGVLGGSPRAVLEQPRTSSTAVAPQAPKCARARRACCVLDRRCGRDCYVRRPARTRRGPT